MAGWILFLGGIGLVAFSALKGLNPIICLPVALIWWLGLLHARRKKRNLKLKNNNPSQPITRLK